MIRRRSTIPRALTALVAVCSATNVGDEIDSLTVFDSTLMSEPRDYLVIGYDDDEELPPVTGGRNRASYAQGDNTEDYDVLCLLTTWQGGTDIAATRDTLFGYLDALDARLDASNRLDNLVAYIGVGDYSLAQPITADEGATATLRFFIHIEAWRKP